MNWFCDSGASKEIVLKMVRDVGTEKMTSAIGDAIGSRMGGKDKAALNQLTTAMHAGFEKTGGAKAGRGVYVARGRGADREGVITRQPERDDRKL